MERLRAYAAAFLHLCQQLEIPCVIVTSPDMQHVWNRVEIDGKWYHVNGGKWVKDTTLVKYNGTWYYVKNGVVDYSNTLCNWNGKWYHVDTTWDDPLPNNRERNTYFLLTDSQIAQDHTWNTANYPASSSSVYASK